MIGRTWSSALAALFFLVAATSPPLAQDTAEDKKAEPPALLLDFSTGTLLNSRNASVAIQPGSTAKLMTAAAVFEALSSGEIAEDTAFPVSEHAWRSGGAPSGGATMFAALKSEVPVLDLLKGLLVQNANDAAIILAEGLEGSEDAFAARMNALAERIGMTGSRFANPTGQDAPGAVTTAADLGRLAGFILSRHMDRYELFSLPDFTWNGIFQRNKNPLIGGIAGVDGLAAGSSDKSGYNGVGSLIRANRRLIGVVAGHPSADARIDALKALFDSLEKDFEDVVLFERGAVLAQARVFGGTQPSVDLLAREPVDVLLPRGSKRDYRLRVVYTGPLKAPVERGKTVGELRVMRDRNVVFRVPLTTAEAVERGTVTSRAADALRETLFGWWLDEG
ncbi:D-alanyl-D-alanine carboxypeptidase family protein [Stappia stellulata]|uniref:D-alanyl-D-alanine carboxypeptidase family protein n=1 Tax=Stappia stellulata TaxID=71235 RepID=UPI0003F9CDAC|nr:D-alanyl-D-alanine carboxypeptidase family protein [Stappia stellulata]